MKILVATGLYPPDIGGPATYSKMLEEHLPKFGIDVVIAPFGWVRHYPKVIRHMVYAFKLVRELRTCDMVYALDPVSVGVPAYVASVISRKPFLLRVAGDYAWEQGQLRFGVKDRLELFYQKRFSYGLRVSILSYTESFIANRAKLIIIPCAYLRKVMSVWGVANEKVHVIYSALFPLVVGETKESLRKQLSYSGTVILSAGRLVPNKGFIKLIEVFAEILKERDDVSLIIVGDGPQESELKELIQKKKLESKVRLSGRLTKDALGAAIKGSDLFVLNTEHEGFSHQLLEVMDLGVPVITTNVGGNPELIEDGTTGLLVEFNNHSALKDAIVRVIDEDGLREKLSQKGREKTLEFDQVKLVKEISELLKNKIVID